MLELLVRQEPLVNQEMLDLQAIQE